MHRSSNCFCSTNRPSRHEVTSSWEDLLRPGDANDFFREDHFPRFDPSAIGFRLENAAVMAELSRLVYRHDCEEDEVPPQPGREYFLQRAGLRQRRFFLSRATDTQGVLVESEEPPLYTVLVFRGTEQRIKDFATDLEIRSQPLTAEGMSVHSGFASALDSVWDEILSELSALTSPVFYTGHSLGAALATLAAWRRAPRALYTFGSPMVGNAEFVNALRDVPTHRVVDGEDIIPTLPPEALGFCHAGDLHRIPEAPSSGRFSFAKLAAWIISPPKPFADHAPVNYVRGILRELAAGPNQS